MSSCIVYTAIETDLSRYQAQSYRAVDSHMYRPAKLLGAKVVTPIMYPAIVSIGEGE